MILYFCKLCCMHYSLTNCATSLVLKDQSSLVFMSRVSFHICNSVIDQGVHCGSVVLIIRVFRSLGLLVHKYITHSPSKYSQIADLVFLKKQLQKEQLCKIHAKLSVAGISQEPAKATYDSKKSTDGMQPKTDSVRASQQRRTSPQICPFPIQGSFCFSKNEEYIHTYNYLFQSYIRVFQIQWISVLNSVEWWFKDYPLSTHANACSGCHC